MMKKNRTVVILIMAVAFAVTAFYLDPCTPAFAETKKDTVSGSILERGKLVTYDNMPYNGENSIISEYEGQKLTLKGVQNFDFTPDGKYILNIHECPTEKGMTHSLITRCVLQNDDAKYRGASGTCVDATILAGYGHGEVLCVTQPDLTKEEYELWVGCTPTTEGKPFATEIARVTYTVDPTNHIADITKVVKITGFRKGNVVKGKPAYFKNKAKVDRMNCAVDTGSNQVVFRVKLKKGYGSVYLSYDFQKLNAALDKVDNNKKYNIAKAAKWQKANVRCSLTPLNTFQSFDVDGNNLYLCGGNFEVGAEIWTIRYKIQKNGKTREQYKGKKKHISSIITIDPELTIRDSLRGKDDLEIEGLKVVSSDQATQYYVNFLFKGSGLRDSTSIYGFML